jgi:hypothetical protein
MEFLQELWVPIVVSAFACFAASALAWTVLPHHKREWKRLPTEAGVLDALRQHAPPPGLYAIPFAMGADLNRADLKLALEKGPVGFVTIRKNGPPNMAIMLVQMVVFFVLSSTLCAYVAWHAGLRYGAHPRTVFRVVAAVAAMAYTLGSVQESIWFGRPWKSWLKQCADGLAFALITAGTFAWMWPL